MKKSSRAHQKKKVKKKALVKLKSSRANEAVPRYLKTIDGETLPDKKVLHFNKTMGSQTFLDAIRRRAEKRKNQMDQLLSNIKLRLPELTALFTEMSGHWQYEDPIYRFYHESFKVYHIQTYTKQTYDILRSIAPTETSLHEMFENIITAGTGLKFEPSHNTAWYRHTRPLLEAFFHARFFLEMAIKYGKELDTAPTMCPSGWAALLSLYNLI